MALTEFLRGGLGNDLQERITHPDLNVEVFPQDDDCWQLIKQIDAQGGLTPEEEIKLHILRPEVANIGEFLGTVTEQLLVNPQIRMKNTLHVSGKEPTHLSVVGMLTHWQDRFKTGMTEDMDRLMIESYKARSVVKDVLKATTEYKNKSNGKHYSEQDILSLMSTSNTFELRLPASISNNVPPELSQWDVYNALMNTGKGLRLAQISQDFGYPVQSYFDLVEKADEEATNYVPS